MMAEKKQQTKPLTAKELDDTLSKIYYAPGGFHGITALHSRLPKGAASKEKVRGWLSSQKVGRYMQTQPPKVVFAHFTKDWPTLSTKPTFSSSHMTGWAARHTSML